MIAPVSEYDATSNDDLERRVINFLAARHIPGVRWLKVHAKQGIVTISGNVRSFYQKQLCSHAARRVAGVVALVDQINVA
jgi:osmotically-inducible protein OsmY